MVTSGLNGRTDSAVAQLEGKDMGKQDDSVEEDCFYTKPRRSAEAKKSVSENDKEHIKPVLGTS